MEKPAVFNATHIPLPKRIAPTQVAFYIGGLIAPFEGRFKKEVMKCSIHAEVGIAVGSDFCERAVVSVVSLCKSAKCIRLVGQSHGAAFAFVLEKHFGPVCRVYQQSGLCGAKSSL